MFECSILKLEPSGVKIRCQQFLHATFATSNHITTNALAKVDCPVNWGESGSMFPDLTQDGKILAVTASNAKCFGCDWRPEMSGWIRIGTWCKTPNGRVCFGESSPKWPEVHFFSQRWWNILTQSDAGNHQPYRISKHLFVSKKTSGSPPGAPIVAMKPLCHLEAISRPVRAFVTCDLANGVFFFDQIIYTDLSWCERSSVYRP